MATVYIREDGTGDYTTLAAAITANEIDIEIHGVWENSENAILTIDDNSTVIEAFGSSRHSGYVGSSPSHWRFRPTTSGDAITLASGISTQIVFIGLDIKDTSFDVDSMAIDAAVGGDDASLKLEDCIIWGISKGRAQDGIQSVGNVDLINCVVYGFDRYGLYVYKFTAGTTTVNVNSCTFWDNGVSTGGGILGSQFSGTVNINVFNSIVVDNYMDFDTVVGTVNWNIDYCIDSDGSIDTEDPGAVGCLTSHNETDDCGKSSDGDWVIFEDITSSPYDLRLCRNDDNEAQEMHASSTGSGLTIPTHDCLDKPREADYSCGAWQQPWIVKSSDGDYTTLSAAVAANKLNIEIQGTWVSAEDAGITVDDDNTTIEASGEARHPGYVGSSPTHHRIRTTGSFVSIYALNLENFTVIGLDIWRSLTEPAAGCIEFVGSTGGDNLLVKDCLLWDASENGATPLFNIRIFTNATQSATVENCIFINGNEGGLMLTGNTTSGHFELNVNSCTIWNCNRSEQSNRGGMVVNQTTGTVSVNVFNTICVGNDIADFVEFGSPTWDIHYSIDSDNTIASMDGSGVGNLASRNETDDCSKSSDGDWVIFEDITTSPYDLRLCENAYNEALDAHQVSEHATDVQQLPGRSADEQDRYVT